MDLSYSLRYCFNFFFLFKLRFKNDIECIVLLGISMKL